MGVDSGLPDYRGNRGLWRAYPRLQHLGLSFEEMATPVWFEENPLIHRNQCAAPCHDAVWQDTRDDLDIDLEQLEARGRLPTCPECANISRPNVLMFNDWSWISDVTAAQIKGYGAWIGRLRSARARVAIVELGAGTRLPTIRYESERLAAELDGTLVRINTREPEGPEGTMKIRLGALEALERIEAVLSPDFNRLCGRNA